MLQWTTEKPVILINSKLKNVKALFLHSRDIRDCVLKVRGKNWCKNWGKILTSLQSSERFSCPDKATTFFPRFFSFHFCNQNWLHAMGQSTFFWRPQRQSGVYFLWHFVSSLIGPWCLTDYYYERKLFAPTKNMIFFSGIGTRRRRLLCFSCIQLGWWTSWKLRKNWAWPMSNAKPSQNTRAAAQNELNIRYINQTR